MTALIRKDKLLTSMLALVFFFSGFSALIYQVSWQRLLTLYYGVGAISVTIIISVYMLGLGLGSLVGGFWAERVKDKVILYFIIEFLLACFGFISLPLLKFLGLHTAGSDYSISFLYMFLFLCIPTFLMGVTLPLLTKIFNRVVQNFLDTLSFLYFINTLGAAAGSIVASFILISFFGIDSAVYFAATINLMLALCILITKYMTFSDYGKENVSAVQDNNNVFIGRVAYLLVFITGFLAIGYEIIWFRIIVILVKASSYAFPSVLCVYLLGISIGSFIMSKYLKNRPGSDQKSLFFTLQFLIGVYVSLIFIAYYYATTYTSLDFFTLTSFAAKKQALSEVISAHNFFLNKDFYISLYVSFDTFIWSAIFVFIPTIFMGASFPLIASLALARTNEEGKTVGKIYFFNIVGNTLGGIITGFLLLSSLSTENTLLIFSCIGILFGLFVREIAGRQVSLLQRVTVVLVLMSVSSVFFFKEGELYLTMHTAPGENYSSYVEEGVDVINVTYQKGPHIKNYINGNNHGGRPSYGFYYETIEAMSYADKINNILIIGFGTGSIVEAALKLDDVEKVTLVELSNTVMKNLTKMPLFEKMLADKRINLIIDDGRRFLLRTDIKFDVILMDPLRTTTAYSNNIYSREFFELARQHLETNGVLMTWIDPPCEQVLHKTITSVFNEVRAYNFFTLSSNDILKRNERRYTDHINSFSSEARNRILHFDELDDMYLGDQTYLKGLTERSPINEDMKPVCEYYFGKRIKEKLFYN